MTAPVSNLRKLLQSVDTPAPQPAASQPESPASTAAAGEEQALPAVGGHADDSDGDDERKWIVRISVVGGLGAALPVDARSTPAAPSQP